MIDGLKPYPKYKDSGLSWLGKIPTHWNEQPGFVVFDEKQEKNLGLREKCVLSLSYGRIVIKPDDKLHGLVPDSFETYQIVNPGDIIIRSTDLQNDWKSLRVGLVRDRGIITSAYLCFHNLGSFTPEFAFFLLYSYDLQKFFYGLGSGLRQNLDFGDFRRLPFPIPSRDEQDAIVRFLDYTSGRIERAIRAKKKLIALLNEQKQAIIHRAVTRGLDPNAPHKPSGIPWLDDIPEHWEVRKLRTVADMIVSNVDKHLKPGEERVRLCNYTDVYKNEFITSALYFMVATATKDEITRFKIRIGDVIITKDSEEWDDIGVPALVGHEADDLICGYHLAMLRTRTELLRGEFLFRALQDRFIATQMHIRAKGVTRYGLSHQGIKEVLLPIPPTIEQDAICAGLTKDLSRFNIALARAGREIELLREYRTRLVADVVTGKLDVRAAAAKLPAPETESAVPLDEASPEEAELETAEVE